MKLHNNKKLTMMATIALCISIVAAGTFAWVTSSDNQLNRFETASSFSGDLTISEIFTPPTDWMPGQSIVKDVSVLNTGDVTMCIRVSFEEILSKINHDWGYPFITDDFDSIIFGTGSRFDGNLELDKAVPVRVNTTGFMPGVNGWFTPANIDYAEKVDPLPAGAVVSVCQVGSIFSAKAWIPITYNGESVNQAINLGKFEVLESIPGSSGYDTILISGVSGEGKILYPFYDGYSTTEASWGGTNQYTTAGTGPDMPATADIGKAVADYPDYNILLGYVTANMNNSAPEAGKWFYNPADGYFYFCSAVAPGGSTTSLLADVTLNGGAGIGYSGMFFDLGVVAEGIQKTEEALRAADGWNLSNAALIAALLA